MNRLVLALLTASACTPGMHRAYQTSMGATAVVGWGAAGVMTVDALERHNSPYVETRPVFGLGPRAQLVTFQLVNLAVVVGLRMMPDLFDEDTPWVKDVLLTTCAALGTSDAYGDYTMMHH
ncbi:MAG: hypothetical protein V4479_07595 [Actinomycetota bacterium]